MTPRRTNQLLKGLLIVLVLIAVAGLFFTNKSLTLIAKDTAKLRADVEIGQKQIDIYQQTQAKANSLSFVNDLANKVLPPSEDQSTTVAEISQFATRHSLVVDNISFLDGKKSSKDGLKIPKGVTVVPIVITLHAGAQYNNLLDFLKTIETNQRKMQVTNLTLQPDATNRSHFTKISIAMNIFARNPVEGDNK